MDTGLGAELPLEFQTAFDYTVSLPKNKRKHVVDIGLKDFIRMTGVSPWVVKDDGFMRLLKEWVIFDWPFYKHNCTMLEEYMEYAPPDTDEELMDVIRQAHDTNTVCEFFVEGAFPEEAAVVLRDIATNQVYVVRDGVLSSQLAQEPVAMLGARLVKVGDDWMMPTAPVFMVGGTFDDAQKEAIAAEAEPVDFCDLVRSAYQYLEAMGYPDNMPPEGNALEQ